MHIYTDGFLIQRLTLNLNVIYSHVCHRPFLKSSGQTAQMIKKHQDKTLFLGPPQKKLAYSGHTASKLAVKKHVNP